mgnify:CR=1 FL=1
MDERLYLAHYGIKGMRWGVRRYQNYDGSYTEAGKKRYGWDSIGYDKDDRDVVLPKGTTFQRITTASNNGITNGVYMSYKTKDMDYYKGQLGRLRTTWLLRNNQDAKLNELKLEARTEIRLPAKKTRVSEFKKLYDKDPDAMMALINEHEGRSFKKFNSNNELKTQEMYQRFNDALALGQNAKNAKVIQKYYDALSKKGYNAIPDENDIRLSTAKTNAPIIMFNTDTSIGNVSQREVTAGELLGAYNRSRITNVVDNVLFGARGAGVEKLNADTVKKTKKYAAQIARDSRSLNANYTVQDLAEDWSKNRLTDWQIHKVSNLMDEGESHDEAVAQVSGLGNVALDKVMKTLIPDW